MLSIRHLNKSFGKTKVLKDFSFDFDRGIFGLLGANGAGKTTLLRCITQLYNTPRDTILFQGECVRHNRDYLANIGYLPQKFGLFKDLTVTEMMRLFASLKNLDVKSLQPQIDECIELVNLGDCRRARAGALSGGMIRRLGIAQALLGDPDILIFDEPTAGLDPEERLRFKNILSQISKNKVVIISTHIVEDVEAVCDHIVIIKEGQAAADGTCSDIRRIAQGKVFLVPETDEHIIQGEYVVQKRIEREDQVWLKILTNTPQQLETTTAEVEDGYICVLKGLS